MVNIPRIGYAGILGLTIFTSFINLIISAILVRSYNNDGYPSGHIQGTTRFTLFVSLWNLILGGGYVFFVLRLATSVIASVASSLIFLFLTWIFWLAAAASAEDALGGAFSCSNPTFNHCHQLRAMEAFSWINFIVLFIAFAGVGWFGYSNYRRGSGLSGPIGSV